MGFANEKGWNKQIFLGYFSNGEGVDFVDTLKRSEPCGSDRFYILSLRK